jgi:predicted ATPase/class 3 adenylate cyclase
MPLPSGTVTFLFTDIEGSTQLWESAPEAMRSALERHDAMARSAIDAHGGYVFATGGDGFCVAFGRAADALSAAVELQEALAGERWPEGAVIRARMGVHAGEASERDGNYFGTAVNRAARLMATAHGGQLVCSKTAAALADPGVGLVSLGEHRLRDLAAAETVFQVGEGAFPPLRSVDAVPTNLPTMRTELIGRSDEVDALAELVAGERLVTFTGTGGVGKTRLALAVAALVSAEFPDGCWFVELAPVADGAEVPKAVAAAMRAPVTTTPALGEYLADRRALIVLDNCEHLLDGAADLVDEVLMSAGDVHVVVTSREPLGLEGESVRRIRSLAMPEESATVEEARSVAAVRLFTDRAVAATDSFTLDDGNVEAVVEICRHLDGIPLAIELAASRVRAMAPAEIARRLDERFRLLAGGSRRSQERHRTLQAAVSWSHDLLTDDEQFVFRRLAVFPGSFDLAAAEAVAATDDIDVVDCVLRLVDRSLVVFDPESDRYRLLETLRQYGADRLIDAEETNASRERHADHYLGFAEWVAPQLSDARISVARPTVIAELDNLRAVVEWCVDNEQWAEIAGLCDQLWIALGQNVPIDVAAWLQHALDHESAFDGQAVVDMTGDMAWIHGTLGNLDVSMRLAEQSHAAAVEPLLASPTAAWSMASVALYTGRPSEARDAAEVALRTAEARDDERLAVFGLCTYLGALAELRDVERCAEVTTELLRRAEATRHPVLISSAVLSASSVHITVGDQPDFEACLEVLTSHDIELAGDLNDMWIDIIWGLTLVGLDRPGAADRLVRGVREADRLSAPMQLDLALRTLAIAAAEAGLVDQALALVDYCEDNLRPYRMDTAIPAWIDDRLDGVLPERSEPAPKAPLRRGELMALVTEIERSLTRAESVVP